MDQGLLKRYNTPEVAENYKNEYKRKLHRKISDRLEKRIFRSFLERIQPLDTLLDLPSGPGRLFRTLEAYSKKVIEADFSLPMLILSRKETNSRAGLYLRCNALAVPLKDSSVDCVVSIRLNHHIDSEAEREKGNGPLL